MVSIVLHIRSPSNKRGRSTWLNARADCNTSLCLARVDVCGPSSSVMDIDGIMKTVKKLLLTYMQKPSNKLRSLHTILSAIYNKPLVVFFLEKTYRFKLVYSFSERNI